MALLIEQAPGQESGRAPDAAAPLDRLRRELCLYGREQGGIEDGLMIPPKRLAMIDHLTDVEPVSKEMGKGATCEGDATINLASRQPPNFRDDFAFAKIVGKGAMDRAKCADYWGAATDVCNEFKK